MGGRLLYDFQMTMIYGLIILLIIIFINKLYYLLNTAIIQSILEIDTSKVESTLNKKQYVKKNSQTF